MIRQLIRTSIRLLAAGCLLLGLGAAEAQTLKIGIIGTGKIGGALATHWAAAGHEIVVSSRHPEELEDLAAALGPKVSTGTPAEAAAFGDVILVSIPYAAMPQVGRDLRDSLAGKVVIDTSNPIESRDGAMAIEMLAKGSGIASAELLGNVRLVRAFNCIPAESLANEGNRRPERIAIPLASNDVQALAVGQRLVAEAGFDSVIIGDLDAARHFDLGEPLALGTPSARELRAAAVELGVLAP